MAYSFNISLDLKSEEDLSPIMFALIPVRAHWLFNTNNKEQWEISFCPVVKLLNAHIEQDETTCELEISTKENVGLEFCTKIFNNTFLKKFKKFASENLNYSQKLEEDIFFSVYDYKKGIIDCFFMEDIFWIRIYLEELFKEKNLKKYSNFFLHPSKIKEFCSKELEKTKFFQIKDKWRLLRIIRLVKRYEI